MVGRLLLLQSVTSGLACNANIVRTSSTILAIRGGASSQHDHQIPIDIKDMISPDGVAPMMTAMSSYAMVGSLILGSGLYLFDITPKRHKDYEFTKSKRGYIERAEKMAVTVFAIVSSISIATSLRTVIIFHIMSLYIATASSPNFRDRAVLPYNDMM